MHCFSPIILEDLKNALFLLYRKWHLKSHSIPNTFSSNKEKKILIQHNKLIQLRWVNLETAHLSVSLWLFGVFVAGLLTLMKCLNLSKRWIFICRKEKEGRKNNTLGTPTMKGEKEIERGQLIWHYTSRTKKSVNRKFHVPEQLPLALNVK